MITDSNVQYGNNASHVSTEAGTLPLQLNYHVEYNDKDGSLLVYELSSTGQTPVHYIWMKGPTLVTLEIIGNIKFNKIPIEWAIGYATAQVSEDYKKIYVLLDKPPSPIMPMGFVLVVDLDNGIQVRGIRSDMIWTAQFYPWLLSESSSLKKIFLHYNTMTGSFNLDQCWPLQPGQLLLLPHLEGKSITIPISLVDGAGNPDPSLVFDENPISWMGSKPHWIDPIVIHPDNQILEITSCFSWDGMSTIALASPFRFNIKYKGYKLSSPDPIIMNATIGDGPPNPMAFINGRKP